MQFVNEKNITQTDNWGKKIHKKEKTKNIHTAWK